MGDADEEVRRLIIALLHEPDPGWMEGHPPPAHYVECPDVEVVDAEVHPELWFDTGVEATSFTARLRCPHEGEVEWEWADVGELPDLIEKMEKP